MMSLANWTTRILAGGAQANREPGEETGTRSAEQESTVGRPESGDPVGTRVGAYMITKRIGAGGVGQVYKAVDTMLKRDVAIKVLRDELASDPVFLARFRNEAQLQAKLSHSNVASVHAFMQEGDKQLLVMEYVPGIALDEFVRAGGPVPAERALTIFRGVLDGVDHAHSHGIVHRDIKPANIMLADSGQVKVMDFGIARALDSQEQLTRIGHVAGTAKAMSPEQIRGKKADVRSDVYSLGIVLYTLLAGRAPFDNPNDVELMKAQLEQAPPPLRDQVDSVPPMVEAAVMKALEKEPSARFQTVREFAQAIDACLAELAPAPARGMDRGLDAPSTSRTAINPVLQGVKQLPAASAARAQPAGMPRWARLGAMSFAVVALGGGAALLWTMLGAPSDTTGQARAPAAPQAQAPISPPTPAPQLPAPEPAPPMQAAQPPAATAALPAPARATDAAPPGPPPAVEPPKLPTLSIVRLSPGGKADASADAATSHAYRAGERIQLLVKPSADAHVYCYLQDETRRILRFYPNRFQPSSFIRAAAPLEIPGKMRFELVANSLKASETVACFASESNPTAELPASVLGSDFAQLPVASLDEVRAAFARVAGGASIEARLRIEAR
jgi:tRNA A-37 threonylcarbamoyl transferase component Bud32